MNVIHGNAFTPVNVSDIIALYDEVIRRGHLQNNKVFPYMSEEVRENYREIMEGLYYNWFDSNKLMQMAVEEEDQCNNFFNRSVAPVSSGLRTAATEFGLTSTVLPSATIICLKEEPTK